MLQCPCCDFIPVPQAGAVHRDGELIELASRNQAKPASESERRIWYTELKAIQIERSYKPGWAAHKFKEKFGHFPPWSYNDLTPSEPSLSTRNWVRSRQIAYVKAQGARASA
jgi:DNA repair protein RadD